MPDAYVGPTLSTSIGSLSEESSDGKPQPIIIPRSGGYSILQFANKAENWLQAGLGVGEYYDSNVFLRPVKVDDFITHVAPVVAFNYLNNAVSWSLGSSLDYRYYAKNTRTEDFSLALNTRGMIRLYRDYAAIFFSDSFTQTSQSNSIDYSSLSSTTNVTNLNTLRVNPRLELPVTSRVKITPQYAYTNYWYPSKSIQNRQNNQVSMDISYEVSPVLVPYLGYNFNRTDGQLLRYNQHYPYFGFIYNLDRLTLNGAVGYSRLDTDNAGSSDGMVWNASLSYQLNDTRITLATSSDVDQSAYLTDTLVNSYRKAPQLVTSYSGVVSHQFRSFVLTLSLYYRENTDSQTSVLLTRRFGASGSLKHELSSRLNGNLYCRIERGDQWNSLAGLLLGQGSHSLLYEINYGLTYSFGKDWAVSGNYRYVNSTSPQLAYSNYTDNKVSVDLRKTFW